MWKHTYNSFNSPLLRRVEHIWGIPEAEYPKYTNNSNNLRMPHSQPHFFKSSDSETNLCTFSLPICCSHTPCLAANFQLLLTPLLFSVFAFLNSSEYIEIFLHFNFHSVLHVSRLLLHATSSGLLSVALLWPQVCHPPCYMLHVACYMFAHTYVIWLLFAHAFHPFAPLPPLTSAYMPLLLHAIRFRHTFMSWLSLVLPPSLPPPAVSGSIAIVSLLMRSSSHLATRLFLSSGQSLELHTCFSTSANNWPLRLKVC